MTVEYRHRDQQRRGTVSPGPLAGRFARSTSRTAARSSMR